MAVIVSDGRLTLTGDVGDHFEYGGEVLIDGFTYPMVLNALSEIDDDAALTVYINSPGGIATEGAAIRSALADRTGRTDVVIHGMAMSAASLIVMAGETIAMAEDATLMIHDPAGLTFGTAADHEAAIRSLNSLATSYARTYARRAGITPDAAREIMRAETWFGAEEAIAAGFADRVEGRAGAPVLPFPYYTYARAPEPLVAMAREKGWRRRATSHVAAATPDRTEIQSMTKITDDAIAQARREAIAEYQERRSTVMALPEANSRAALAEALIEATTLDVDTLKSILAAAPEAPTAGHKSDFQAAMDAQDQPDLGAGSASGGDKRPDVSALKAAAERRNKRMTR